MKGLALTPSELEALVAELVREISGRKPGMRSPSSSPEVARLARLFDHTMLKPEATIAEIERACEDALEWGCAALIVQPCWITLAANLLQSSDVKAGTVVGFPFGAELPSVKRAAADAAIRAGAKEIDTVMNVGSFVSGDFLRTEMDVRGVIEVCHAAGASVKMILENAYLTDDQKAAACRMAKACGADFVKTSTGFGPSGAAEADVRLMRDAVGPEVGVKAAGGIRTLADALKMLQAGANRLGTSATGSILAQARDCAS